MSSSFFSPDVSGCRPAGGLSIPSNSVDRTGRKSSIWRTAGDGVVGVEGGGWLAGAGDWPENEPGEGKGLEAVSGGCPSRGWNRASAGGMDRGG